VSFARQGSVVRPNPTSSHAPRSCAPLRAHDFRVSCPVAPCPYGLRPRLHAEVEEDPDEAEDVESSDGECGDAELLPSQATQVSLRSYPIRPGRSMRVVPGAEQGFEEETLPCDRAVPSLPRSAVQRVLRRFPHRERERDAGEVEAGASRRERMTSHDRFSLELSRVIVVAWRMAPAEESYAKHDDGARSPGACRASCASTTRPSEKAAPCALTALPDTTLPLSLSKASSVPSLSRFACGCGARPGCARSRPVVRPHFGALRLYGAFESRFLAILSRSSRQLDVAGSGVMRLVSLPTLRSRGCRMAENG
jgi:hypothetical protein